MEIADKAYNLFIKELDLIPETTDVNSEDPMERSSATTRTWGNRVISGYETAKAQANSEEKKARLVDGIVKEVSQLTFVLFRRNLLTDEIVKEYRELPLFEITDNEVNKFLKTREEEVKKIAAERDAIGKVQRELDIFQAILTQGMTPEDAEAEMQKYEARQQAGLPKEA